MAIARLGKLSFEFEEEELECENLPEISSEDAKEVLFKTQDVFSKLGIDVYLAYGTLLGAVRDQAIIPGDLDVDVFVKDEKKKVEQKPQARRVMVTRSIKKASYQRQTTR